MNTPQKLLITAVAVLGTAGTAQADVLHTTTESTYVSGETIVTDTWDNEATGDVASLRLDAAGRRYSAFGIDYPSGASRRIVFATKGYKDEVVPVRGVPEITQRFVARMRTNGRFAVAGREGGVVQLRSTRGGQIKERYWVDEATGLPVRSEQRGIGFTNTTRYEFLPATAETVGRTLLSTPEGFAPLSALPGPVSMAYPTGAPMTKRRARR